LGRHADNLTMDGTRLPGLLVIKEGGCVYSGECAHQVALRNLVRLVSPSTNSAGWSGVVLGPGGRGEPRTFDA
jgi:hypothetical protein